MLARAYYLAIVAGLFLAGGVYALRADDAKAEKPRAALEKELKDLLDDRVKTAQLAMDAMQAAYEAQTVTLYGLIDAANKLIEAKLAAATTPIERLAALGQHLERLRMVEQKTEVLYRLGARGGEVKDYALVKRERQSAQIALLREQIKAE